MLRLQRVVLSPYYASETKKSDSQEVWAPYYVLLTANGGCVGQVPRWASDQFAQYSADWTLQGAIKQEEDKGLMRRLQRDLKTAETDRDEAQEVANKVPGLQAELKTAQEEAGKVPGLQEELKTANKEADKLQEELGIAQKKAKKVPGLEERARGSTEGSGQGARAAKKTKYSTEGSERATNRSEYCNGGQEARRSQAGRTGSETGAETGAFVHVRAVHRQAGRPGIRHLQLEEHLFQRPPHPEPWRRLVEYQGRPDFAAAAQELTLGERRSRSFD